MTTISTLATPWAQLEAALQHRRPVEVSYHGRCRLICPHALGWHGGRPMVLGYQTGGQTSTGVLPTDLRKRWRCMYVDEIDHVAAADPASQWHTADNYNPARPFAAIDEVAIADHGRLNVSEGDCPAANSG
jgi:hypothetical protein